MNHLTTMKLSQSFVILNATPGMAWEDVKKTYHQLAKQYHPDLNPRDLGCENKFKELNGAFKVLETHYKNPKRNRLPSSFFNFQVRSKSPLKSAGNAHPPIETVEKLKPKKSAPQKKTNESKGTWSRWSKNLQTRFNKLERKIFLLDTQKNIRVAPSTAAQGGLVRLQTRKEMFQVKIPSGDWRKMLLRVPEKGETSLFGKKRGDLVLNIQVIEPEPLDRDHSKYFYDLHISREKIKSSRVLTLDSVQGPIKFFLPRGTKDGQTFTLKYRVQTGSGAPSPDHVVKIHLN